MTTHPMHPLCARMALGLGIALAAPCAFAANHTIHWLEMTPTAFGATPTFGSFASGVAGIPSLTVGYTPGTGFSAIRLAHPLLQNGSLLAPNQDTYSWGVQELLARTYLNQATPNIGSGSGLNQSWGVTFSFDQPLAAGNQVVVGVMGLGRRLPDRPSETQAETTTTARVIFPFGSTVNNLGDFGNSNNWGQTVVAAGPNSLTLTNSQIGSGGVDPWWNTGLNLTVVSSTTQLYNLTVMFDQTLGDGVGVNIGFINAVPEPGTWALFAAGLAAVGWKGRRREQA